MAYVTSQTDAVAVPQPVSAPLSRAAIFLVVTINPGADNRAAVRSLCADLAGLVRAVEFRDLEAGLSCVMGIGSDAWDRLFGEPRPAELHPFREFRVRPAPCRRNPGDLLFHIRAKRMDLCFEMAAQIMARSAMRSRRWTRCTAFVTSTTAIFWVSSTARRIRAGKQ